MQYSKLMSSLKLKGYMLKLDSWNGKADHHVNIFNLHWVYIYLLISEFLIVS